MMEGCNYCFACGVGRFFWGNYMKNFGIICLLICLSATGAKATNRVLFCDLARVGFNSFSTKDPNFTQVFQVENGWWSKSISKRENGVWKPWCASSGSILKLTEDSGLCYRNQKLSMILDLIKLELTIDVGLGADNFYYYDCKDQ